MAQKWLVGYNTKNPVGAFKTKREASQWARDNLTGTFFIWKGEVLSWQAPKIRDMLEFRLAGLGSKLI